MDERNTTFPDQTPVYLQSDCKRIQIKLNETTYEAISINPGETGMRLVYDRVGRWDKNELTGKQDPAAFDRYVAQILETFEESSAHNWAYATQKLKDKICRID
jgi:hypothetical protein